MGEGDARRKDAIDETLQYGREVEPPLRKNQNETVSRFQPDNDTGDGGRIVRHIEIAAPLRPRQPRVKILHIEIQKIDSMAGGFECLAGGPRHRSGKAFRQRMGENQQNVHC